MADGIQASKSSPLTPYVSTAQPNFSQTLIAQGKAVAKDSLVASASKAQPVKAVPVKKFAFYQGGDVIYQLGKYRITAAPTGSDDSLDVYVNGKKYSIDVDTTKGKLLVGQSVARMVKEGRFKNDALSDTEDANGNAPHVTNDRVTISTDNAPRDFFSDITQIVQGKTPLGTINSSKEVVEVFGRAAAARGKPFSYVQIASHANEHGVLSFPNGEHVDASYMIKSLIDAGVLERRSKTKKGSIIEFFSCFAGVNFESLLVAANKYGVTIKAPNYATTQNGVKGTGLSGVVGKILPYMSAEIALPDYKIPVKPDILTFMPSGKVFESDGMQITEIKYRRKK
jgi:hypothetical protein